MRYHFATELYCLTTTTYAESCSLLSKSVTKTVNSESLPLGEIAKAAVTGGLLIHYRNAVAAKTDDETICQFYFDDDRLTSHGVQRQAALPRWRPMS